MPIDFKGPLDIGGNQVKNAADGSANTDLVTLQQMQAYVRGLDWKDSVRVGATSNITISAPGATIDGVTMAATNRVLLMGQTTGSENGWYVWNGAAVPMTRATDADISAEVTSGAATSVEEGTANGDKTYVLTTNNPIVLGTTALTFTALGGGAPPTAGNSGISVASYAVSAVAGAGITISSGIAIDTAVVTRKYAVSIGNGSATDIAVTHNLGTRDVEVQVYLSTTPWNRVWVAEDRTDANTVTLHFATAPTTNQYRVVVQG